MGGGPFETSGGATDTQRYQQQNQLSQGQTNYAGTTGQTGTIANQAPTWAQPLLENIAGSAFNLYGNQPAIDPTTQAGLTGAANYAQGQTGLLGQVPSWLAPYASGANVTGGSPAFREMLDYNAGRLGNQINQQWSGAGRYGSAGQAANIGDVVGRFRQGATEQEIARQQGLQLQAAGMMPGAYQAGLLPFSTLQGVGAAQQGAPWQQLGTYTGILGGLMPQAFGTQARDITGTTAGGTTSAGGTATTTQGMDSTQTQAPWFGQTGMANLGNIGMALLGSLFSDRTAKTDIKKLGTDEATGLPIYAYRYKGDPKTYPKVIGPMAQEVEKKFPGSTGLLDGKMFIKPEAMGLLGGLF